MRGVRATIEPLVGAWQGRHHPRDVKGLGVWLLTGLKPMKALRKARARSRPIVKRSLQAESNVAHATRLSKIAGDDNQFAVE